jgi:hypothetical protein
MVGALAHGGDANTSVTKTFGHKKRRRTILTETFDIVVVGSGAGDCAALSLEQICCSMPRNVLFSKHSGAAIRNTSVRYSISANYSIRYCRRAFAEQPAHHVADFCVD